MRAGAGWFPRRCGAGGLLEDAPCFLLLALFYFIFIYLPPHGLCPGVSSLSRAREGRDRRRFLPVRSRGMHRCPPAASFPSRGRCAAGTKAGSGQCRPAWPGCRDLLYGDPERLVQGRRRAGGLSLGGRASRGASVQPRGDRGPLLLRGARRRAQSLLPYVEEMLAVSSSQSCCI